MNPQDESNIVRFLIDLARGIQPEDRERVNGRMRGDLLDPSPEATDGEKPRQTASGKRREAFTDHRRHWPARKWWQYE